MKKTSILIWFLVLFLFAIGFYAFMFQDDPIQQIGILSMLLAGFLSFFLIIKLSFNEKDKVYKFFLILSALICPLTIINMLNWQDVYLIHDYWGTISLFGLLIVVY